MILPAMMIVMLFTVLVRKSDKFARGEICCHLRAMTIRAKLILTLLDCCLEWDWININHCFLEWTLRLSWSSRKRICWILGLILAVTEVISYTIYIGSIIRNGIFKLLGKLTGNRLTGKVFLFGFSNNKTTLKFSQRRWRLIYK